MNRKKITYTESGRMRLEYALIRHQQLIEDLVRRESYVPGEDLVEITASDVERALQRLSIRPRVVSDTREIITWLYLVLGVAAVAAGLFFEEFMKLLKTPPQLALISVGAVMILVALWFRWRLSQRSTGYRELERGLDFPVDDREPPWDKS